MLGSASADISAFARFATRAHFRIVIVEHFDVLILMESEIKARAKPEPYMRERRRGALAPRDPVTQAHGPSFGKYCTYARSVAPKQAFGCCSEASLWVLLRDKKSGDMLLKEINETIA